VLARTADAHRDLGWQFERREVSKRYVAIVAGHLAGHPAGHPTRHATDDLAGHPTRHATDDLAGHPSRHLAGHLTGHPAGHPTGIVAGHLATDEGEIDLPLRKALADGPRHVVDPVHGKPAITRWRVVERTTLGRLRDAIDAIADRGLAAGSPIASSADPASPITRLHLVPLTGRSHQLRVHLRHLGHAVLGDEFYASPEVLALASRLMLHAEALTFRDPVDGRAIDLRADAGW